jgi:lysyl-tRNA synthetase class 2
MTTSQRPEQELVRFAKLDSLQAAGFRYPNDVKRTGWTTDVLAEPLAEPIESGRRFVVAGRVILMRQMGKASFLHILDTKARLQLYVRADAVGPDHYKEVINYDIGDIIEARGYAFVTKTGEKSLHVESVRLLVKALVPLPEKWAGLTDVESRYRQRYVDLIANPEVRDVFRMRARIVSSIRSFLDNRDFLEVETPVLQSIAGGTTARPFNTHHNALGIDMSLRIALELPLKRLVVGGLERVYELGRCFRNEGLSKRHNPEFTMLELYEAFATFEDHMTMMEELITSVVLGVKGASVITYQGQEISFEKPWPRLSMSESLYVIGGVSRDLDVHSYEVVSGLAKQHGVQVKDSKDWGHLLEGLFEALVEPKIRNPTFITHHPASISPLARRNDANPSVCDRYELFLCGMELANGYSELNDPIDQRQRFMAQAEKKAGGDLEACDVDEDYLRALEYGLPPTAGDGMGIDRLAIFLTDVTTIRDVLLFPQMKPEGAE